jgi:hypothetical protein
MVQCFRQRMLKEANLAGPVWPFCMDKFVWCGSHYLSDLSSCPRLRDIITEDFLWVIHWWRFTHELILCLCQPHGSGYYYPHCTNMETEAQISAKMCPKTHNWSSEGTGVKDKSFWPQSQCPKQEQNCLSSTPFNLLLLSSPWMSLLKPRHPASTQVSSLALGTGAAGVSHPQSQIPSPEQPPQLNKGQCLRPRFQTNLDLLISPSIQWNCPRTVPCLEHGNWGSSMTSSWRICFSTE